MGHAATGQPNEEGAGPALDPDPVLSAAAVAVFWLDLAGRIRGANDAALALVQRPAGELLGRPFTELAADVSHDPAARAARGEIQAADEVQLRAGDGTLRYVNLCASPLVRDGARIGTLCVAPDVTAQVRRQHELQQTVDELTTRLQQLDAALHQMPSAVVIAEAPSGKILLRSDKHASIFRVPKITLASMDETGVFRGVRADGRAMQIEDWPLSRSIRSGEVVKAEEIRILRGDGTEGYIRLNSAPIRDASGTIVAGVVTYDDITASKQAGLDLAEQHRVNEVLLRLSTTLSSELDLDALMQRFTDEARLLCRAQFGSFFYNVQNQAGESYMLYTLSGVARAAFANFPMPRNTAIFAPTFAGSGVVRSDDITQDPRYGRSAPFHGMPRGHLPVRSYLAVPVKSRSGTVLGGLFFGHTDLGVFTEQDERLLVAVSAQAGIAIDNARLYQAARRAEASAERERTRLHQLFMQAPAFITIQRGPNHVYEFINPATERLLGKHVLGKAMREAFPAIDPGHVGILDRVYCTGQRYNGNEFSATLDWDGTGRPYERFFSFVYEPYRDENGKVDGVLSFGSEVTDQVLARRRVEAVIRELEAAARTKDEFLATVSHELRTPLNAILGWVQMLRSGTLSDEHRARALLTIERNAVAQTQLIEDLLDVSRIISGKLRLEVRMVDLPTVVESAIEAVRPAAQAKGVLIQQTLDPQAPPILGDSQRLQQVIWNLLSNAVKFTPRGGRIHIVVQRRDSSIEVLVHDNGQGIEPSFLGHVFERFRQADATTTRAHGGLGLGLAIVRHLVELHGGTVRAESGGKGQGATFTVSLPVAPLRTAPSDRPPVVQLTTAATGLACPNELAGLHILVVDDEPDARELLAALLSPCLARVTTASSAAEALRLIRDEKPDLLISDIGMPGEDGYALISQLRALPREQGGRIPAVALTAYARSEDRTRALIAGFNMHVPKPVEPRELLVVLASLATMFVPRPASRPPTDAPTPRD